MGTRHFGSAAFDKDYWMDGKAVFSKPIGVDVEFVTTGEFDWIFADTNGVEVKTSHCENLHGGWTSIDLASLGLFDDYSIGFRNASSGKHQIKQIDVRLP